MCKRVPMESFSSADLFQEDVMGSLLPLLSTADTKSLLLTCKAFNTAIKRQLRILSPLYLPVATTAAWGSLESLHLPLSRSSTDRYGQHEACASHFTWLAPIRGLSSLCAFHHTAQVDLSSQELPTNANELLSRHLTLLRGLNLDGCKMPITSMINVAAITTLRSLSVSGIQLNGSLPVATGCQESVLSAQQHQATAGSGTRAAKSITCEDAGQLLDALCQLQLQELRMDLKASTRDLFGLPHVPPFTHGYGIPLLNNGPKLAAMRHLVVLSLIDNIFNASDWRILCDALGPNLQELHITWGSKDPEQQQNLDLSPEIFSHISKLTNLTALTLEMSSCHRSAPYTLAPVANTLTELKLTGPASIPLVLSLTECSKVVRLELSKLEEAALNELLVQVVSSMPKLQSLRVSRLQAPDRVQAAIQPMGDCLLRHLDTCCLLLTELWMPDLMLNGTGVNLVASAASDTCSGTSVPAAGGVRSCQHIELSAMYMMRSAFPHLSYLTGLQSLSLHGMAQKQFPHLCKLGCLNSLTALNNLTSLRILPVIFELAKWERELAAQQVIEANGGFVINEGNAAGLAEQAAVAHAAAQHLLGNYQEEDQGIELEAEDGSEAAYSSEAELSDDHMAEADTESNEDHDDDDGHQQQQQLNDWAHMAVEEPDQEPHNEEEAEEDPADHADLEAAQQAANQAVQALAQELHHQANILANNPAQQVLAGGAFQAVAHMLLPQGMVGHLAGPGAAAAQAAVAALQDLAQQLAQNAAPAPEGAGAVAAVQNALQAVAAEADGQLQQAPAIPYAGMYGLRHHPFEPHLHFLNSMTGLVNLELSCLQTTGLCFLHLSNLQSLRSLVLGGVITLNDDAWGFLAGLRLPGVTTLSLTGCSVRSVRWGGAGGPTADIPAASSSRNGSSGTVGAITSESAGASSSAAASASPSRAELNTWYGTGMGAGNLSMGSFVHAVCSSFPGVVNLEIGSCRFLTKGLLIQLAMGLKQLERLRLLGVPGAALYVADDDKCAGGAAGTSDHTEQQQQSVSSPSKPAGNTWSQLSMKNRSVVETQSAINRLSSLVRRREAALCLKYVELCETEIPRGVVDICRGLQMGAGCVGAGRSVPFVWHDRHLTPWRP